VNRSLSFGLSALPPHVARTVATSYGHHRTPWFEEILMNIDERLRPALGDRYTPLFLTCTGLGAREAAVANLVRPGDRVVATDGDFSQLARAWGAAVETWPAALADGLVPDAVLIEHVAPSGQVFNIDALVADVRRLAPHAPIVLDASMSFGVDFVDVPATGADAVLIVPERGLMGIPGVTVFAVTEAFMNTVALRRPDLPEAPFLFDLIRYRRASAKHTTPFSPNISACVALQAALEHVDAGGGLQALQLRHQQRTEAIRRHAVTRGFRQLTDDGPVTNAFTSLALPETLDVTTALGQLADAGIDGRASGPSTIEISHVGYLPGNPTEDLSVEPPFTIGSSEFIDQAGRLAKRSTTDDRVRARIVESAKRLFPDRHIVHEDALRHRVVGFVGAGRIVKSAVELCRKRGIEKLMVFAPSLASSDRAGEWAARGAEVARTLDDLFTTAHAVVLLPLPYDDLALRLFRKPREYHNEGLVSERLLEKAHQAGRLDLIINAAARGALIDRAAVVRAVGDGWLRYYSDEMPSAGDPLLDLDEARFTAHVGGSCRAPQAAVARNSHEIVRQLIRGLLDVPDEVSNYRLSIVNAHLLGASAAKRQEHAARDISRSKRIRILLTDPFDVESLAFDRLSSLGVQPEVHDISAEAATSERLMSFLEETRPHIVMLRSRTRVDAEVGAAMAKIDELAFVVRPGVGVDNMYGGMEILSAQGVQIINEPYGNSAAVAEMTLHFILSGTSTTILAPGPTKFQPEVFDVASIYDEARLSRSEHLWANTGRAMSEWLGTNTQAIVLSGPGTSLMEASIASLTMPGSRGLVVSNGKFGDRFVEIAQARGRDCDVLRVAEEQWGKVITPADIERHLQADTERSKGRPRISFLCFQQNETSSGATYHQDSIRSLVHAARAYNPEMILIADAISGALAHRLDFDALDLDVLFAGSQKALGVSSGLAFGVLSERAIGRMLARAGYSQNLEAFCGDNSAQLYLDTFDRLQHVHSINLLRAVVAARQERLTDTPSLFHLLSAERALELLRREGGPEPVAARHAALARLVRDGVQRLGLELMSESPYQSDSVTVVILPEGLDASSIRKAIARHSGIAVAGAQGDYWKSRMLRIGTLGFVTRADVVRCLRALRTALAEAGYADRALLNSPRSRRNHELRLVARLP
jgi:aspartate aminotransferase-like enzyme/phosphoglycerate dehydrogenase-like enzyme